MVSMDNQIRQKGQVRGVGVNPGLLIDSYEMKGKDGYVVYDDAFDTRAEIGFIGGEAVRADGPGKKILETPWLAAGTIRDNMIMFLSYETDTIGTAPSIANATTILEGKIYKRNPKTKEIEKTTTINYSTRSSTQKNPGTPQLSTHNNSFATRYLNFTPQHEYKIELSTSSKLEDGQSVIIDYMYFEFISNQSWMEPRQVGFAGAEASDIGGTVGIPQIESFEVSIALNGSGDGTVVCEPHTEATYITSFKQYNYFYGTFNSIYGTYFSPTSDSGSFSWSITTAETTLPPGGYRPTISVNTGYGGGTLYGFCLMIGHKSVEQI